MLGSDDAQFKALFLSSDALDSVVISVSREGEGRGEGSGE